MRRTRSTAQPEDSRPRGLLTLFFGADAGVGKTYAMLRAAQRLRRQQIDIVLGDVRTHGSRATADMARGLERLSGRGSESPVSSGDLDVEAALKRHPRVLIVDAVAHRNKAGALRPHRWQDIELLLVAGIDVMATLNVADIESLGEVVAAATGISSTESVPDRIFDTADEIVFVDGPNKEGLESAVAHPETDGPSGQRPPAFAHLRVLRRIAMRRVMRTPDSRVDGHRASVHAVSSESDRDEPRMLVCVGPDDSGRQTVRAASERAELAGSQWHAVYVETPALQRLAETRRRGILRTLALAETLGSTTATVAAAGVAAGIVQYARDHGLRTIVLGRSPRVAWPLRLSRRLCDQIADLGPELDVVVVSRGPDVEAVDAGSTDEESRRGVRTRRVGYVWAVASSLLVSLIATPLVRVFDLANIDMLFLLAVVPIAMRFGRRPALAAAVLNVLAFDYFFVPPRFSLAVNDAQYLFTFAVMMIVGLVVGQLTASMHFQAKVARYREQRAQSLYEIARELGKALTQAQVADISGRTVGAAFRAKTSILFPDPHGRLVRSGSSASDLEFDPVLAQWAFENPDAAENGGLAGLAGRQLYVPLKTAFRIGGVIVVEPTSDRLLMIPEQRRLLDTYAALTAIALERLHYVDVAQQASVAMESERLRNSLLSALSHDLRTPLTALLGMSEMLWLALAREGSSQVRHATAIWDHSRQTSRLVLNLLDMARLQAGAVTLRREWQSLEELAESAVRSAGSALQKHVVQIRIPDDLPLVHGDGALLERVLFNLFENAAKYTPPGTRITLSSWRDADVIVIAVSDEGVGLPDGDPDALFAKFSRGEKESSKPGVGLGLSICRAIVDAHGGTITASNAPPPGHGAVFSIAIPYQAAPAIEPHERALTDDVLARDRAT